jgi:hypothetical protein
MKVKIKHSEAVALGALVSEAGLADHATNTFFYHADGTVDVPDAVADKVKAILKSADWPERGLKRALVTHADEARWRRETKTISVNGTDISMDKDTRNQFLVMAMGSGREVRFKTADGKWMHLNADQVRTYQAAIVDRLQLYYAVQEKIEAMINRGQIKTHEQVDAAFDKELG